MLKSAGKQALRTMARALIRAMPMGAQQTILDGVIDELDCFKSFQRVGSRLGIESVRGANGLVWGSIRVLLGQFWRSNHLYLIYEFAPIRLLRQLYEYGSAKL